MSTVYALHGAVGSRAFRAFVRDAALLGESHRAAWEAEATRDFDADDNQGAVALAELLDNPSVRGTAHPVDGVDGAWGVYLAMSDGERVFATMLLTPARVDVMLSEAPSVLEALGVQVLPSEHVTQASVHAAMETWASRNFGRAPAFLIAPWLEPADADAVPLDTGPLRAACGPVQSGAFSPTVVAQPAWSDR